MLTLFKDELSYNDIMYGMSYRSMMSLRDARVARLTKEKEELDREREKLESERIRRQILK